MPKPGVGADPGDAEAARNTVGSDVRPTTAQPTLSRYGARSKQTAMPSATRLNRRTNGRCAERVGGIAGRSAESRSGT
jgi:hypothetical protein